MESEGVEGAIGIVALVLGVIGLTILILAVI